MTWEFDLSDHANRGSGYDQDLAEFRKLYIAMSLEERKEFRETIDRLVSYRHVTKYPKLSQVSVRLSFYTSAVSGDEGEFKKPCHIPKVLQAAIQAWEKNDPYAPPLDFDDLYEPERDS